MPRMLMCIPFLFYCLLPFARDSVVVSSYGPCDEDTFSESGTRTVDVVSSMIADGN